MGKVIAGIVVLIIIIFGGLYLFDVDQEEEGSLPSVEVDVEGDAGSLPEYEVRGPEVETREVTVEVPVVDAPEDDADGEETELVDDEGINADVDAEVDVDENNNR